MAGKDWLKGFYRRQNLSLRTSEQYSIGRVTCVNKVQCGRYFENVKVCYETKGFKSHCVFNMDESGISTVPNKTPKVISPIGKKDVCKVSSGERGNTISAVCCFSPMGVDIPPAMIFPRKRINNELFSGDPIGTLKQISYTGYMNSGLFLEWLNHFVTHVNPSSDDPVFLIVDNHASHCSLAAVLFCRDHHITLLTLPPYASHKLQPLDKFFGPLKTAYASEMEKWLVNHPGQGVTLFHVSGLFRAAHSKMATVAKAEMAFTVT
jgi:hypothetical protein